MRLIDIDEFENNTVSNFERNKNLFGDTEYRDFVKAIIFAVVQDLDKQSIAYDIDKVIEQLEKLEKEHPYRVIGQPDTYSQYNEAWQDCMDRVLGIVKRGGTECKTDYIQDTK